MSRRDSVAAALLRRLDHRQVAAARVDGGGAGYGFAARGGGCRRVRKRCSGGRELVLALLPQLVRTRTRKRRPTGDRTARRPQT